MTSRQHSRRTSAANDETTRQTHGDFIRCQRDFPSSCITEKTTYLRDTLVKGPITTASAPPPPPPEQRILDFLSEANCYDPTPPHPRDPNTGATTRWLNSGSFPRSHDCHGRSTSNFPSTVHQIDKLSKVL